MSDIDNPESFLIINSVALNGGDAAILLAMMKSLKQEFGENIEIKVQAKKHDICKKYYPDIEFMPALENKEKGRNIFDKIFLRLKYPRILFFLLLEKLTGIKASSLLSKMEKSIIDSFREHKNIISCGGGFLNDYYPLHSRMLGFIIARLYNCRYYIYAQSVGPFWRSLSKIQAKWILDNASLVTVRDEKSLDIVKNDIKVNNKNIHLTSDEAHLLTGTEPENNEIRKIREEDQKRLLVGISVRRWEFSDISDRIIRKRTEHRYHRKMMELCIHLVEKYNARIVFISTCQGRQEYFIDDSEFASELIKPLPFNIKNNITVISKAYNPMELKEMFRNFDVFIGVRMHTLILALSSGIPSLGLGYEFKTEELFKQLDLPQYAVNLQSDELENLNEIVDELIDNRGKIAGEIEEKTGILKEKARENVVLLKKAVGMEIEN